MVKESIKINVPPSKSLSQRVLYARFWGGGRMKIHNLSQAEDVKVFAKIEKSIKSLSGNTVCDKVVIDVNESGFWFRVLAASLPVWGKGFLLTGSGSLRNRDFSSLKNALLPLGVQLAFSDTGLPVEVSGKLFPGEFEVDASFSSQHISGLLFTLPLLDGDTVLYLREPVSVPYLKMTMDLLNEFGIAVRWLDNTRIYVPGNSVYRLPESYYVENDWSAAAFFAVYGALVRPVTIVGIQTDSVQGDAYVAQLMFHAGNVVRETENGVAFAPGMQQPVGADLTDYPDLFPPLAVYAAFANGTSVLKGVHRLTNKESNRADALVKEFSKAGVYITLDEDKMVVKGNSTIKQASLSSHNDHRIAMALAMLSVISGVTLHIDNRECVAKSFPDFFEELKKLKI